MDANKMSVQFETWRQEQIASLIRTGHTQAARKFEQLGSIHWIAWQASRAAMVVELPEPDLPETYLDDTVDRDSEEFRYLEARHGAQCQTYRKCLQAIEAQGLKVAP